MRRRTKQDAAVEYTEALLDGIKIGVAGITEMLDGLIMSGVESMELVEVRSLVEQMRMRTALSMDVSEIATDAIRRAAAEMDA